MSEFFAVKPRDVGRVTHGGYCTSGPGKYENWRRGMDNDCKKTYLFVAVAHVNIETGKRNTVGVSSQAPEKVTTGAMLLVTTVKFVCCFRSWPVIVSRANNSEDNTSSTCVHQPQPR